jgi:hypothetical protein
MKPRSLSLRHCASGLVVGGVVAVGLILDPGGLFPGRAEQPAPSPKVMERQDPPQETSPLKARLRAQRLKTRKSKVAYDIARLSRELAEIAVAEYSEGSYAQDPATVDGEIKLADSDRIRAEDRLDWAKRMYEKGFVSKATLVSEQLNFEKAKYTLEQAQNKKSVLARYTGPKAIKALQVDVDKARNDELDKKAAWKHEEAREADLEREVGRK